MRIVKIEMRSSSLQAVCDTPIDICVYIYIRSTTRALEDESGGGMEVNDEE